jgi:hypothetical protein
MEDQYSELIDAAGLIFNLETVQLLVHFAKFDYG